MKLYHGTGQESTSATYFSSSIEDARNFALSIDDCGNYNEEAYIYSIEIDDDAPITTINDFDEFDALAYLGNMDNMEDVICYSQYGWYIVKNNPTLTLEEHYRNEL